MIDKTKVINTLSDFREKERKLFCEMIQDDKNVLSLSHKLARRDLKGSDLTDQDLSTLRTVWLYALATHRIKAFGEILENKSEQETKLNNHNESPKRA